MKLKLRKEPRIFEVKQQQISDLGQILLEDGEMITFVTAGGRECDFAAKEWGFYLGPSLNSRLRKSGFKVALVLNENGQLYVNAVEVDKIEAFKTYLKTDQDSTILCWLDEWVEER